MKEKNRDDRRDEKPLAASRQRDRKTHTTQLKKESIVNKLWLKGGNTLSPFKSCILYLLGQEVENVTVGTESGRGLKGGGFN